MSNDPEMDYRLADDRRITYTVTTALGQHYRWTGTAALLNGATARPGPMILLCNDSTLLNFAHVVSLTPESPTEEAE